MARSSSASRKAPPRSRSPSSQAVARETARSRFAREPEARSVSRFAIGRPAGDVRARASQPAGTASGSDGRRVSAQGQGRAGPGMGRQPGAGASLTKLVVAGERDRAKSAATHESERLGRGVARSRNGRVAVAVRRGRALAERVTRPRPISGARTPAPFARVATVEASRRGPQAREASEGGSRKRSRLAPTAGRDTRALPEPEPARRGVWPTLNYPPQRRSRRRRRSPRAPREPAPRCPPTPRPEPPR